MSSKLAIMKCANNFIQGINIWFKSASGEFIFIQPRLVLYLCFICDHISFVIRATRVMKKKSDRKDKADCSMLNLILMLFLFHLYIL